ncbi:MAG TPA: RNase J family beta-CASP ribonuclease [Candidatus Copromorpha excrementipullorum]|uniref:Ribonuclease J n=1 Tax=Candidatus Allocopromorpha excrementipullorum TaxID=2840743 RepID=A0A9D1SUD6_9FIRM|nr:RNase J family beta-CASP ribonuclease [Anaerovoracaceae bacterium]HIU95096.1 RNase J family beta-CASP ribonuclease [Candidatus Copromorpha excrementipullorum]
MNEQNNTTSTKPRRTAASGNRKTNSGRTAGRGRGTKTNATAAGKRTAQTPAKTKQTGAKQTAARKKQPAANRKKKADNAPQVRIIPLGGLGEIGKNMTAIEYENEIMIIDCGLSFPDDDMFGIDKVIPDFTYLTENRRKIKGLVITHGHEDHIGGIPYLLKEINVPIYGMRFPLGLIENKLREHGLKAVMHVVEAGQTFKLGRHFKVEALRITHSIADSMCLSITTPAGRIFHTGDFKIDYTPVDGNPVDFARLAQIGSEGVLLMMADSTNVLRRGYTPSERVVGRTLENIFRRSDRRIIIATFSSNVHRIQKIIDLALLCKRKVAISGRSMVNVVDLAKELGYIKIPSNMLVDLNKAKNVPDKELVVITTGSQGEPMSALARMASSDHKAIKIKPGDMVILSSSPVPGNELTVSNVVNQLVEKGAEVIYSDIADTHVSGHACQEELKLMHSLIRPKFFMPVHGEFRHLKTHAELAHLLGMPEENIFLLENGDSLTVSKNSAFITKHVAEAEGIMVDGLGVGDVGNIVLRDRRLLSESGLIIVVAAIDRQTCTLVSGPDIISRGFVYVRENEDLIDGACKVADKMLDECLSKNMKDWNGLKTAVREGLRKYIYSKTKRSPVILPIFLEV